MFAPSSALLVPTCDAGKQLLCKMLYLTARKRYKCVALQKIKNALAKQIRDYADVISKVEAFS